MATQPIPPAAPPPPPIDPAIDQKPTGAFSRKTVILVLTAVCTAVFAYLFFASSQQPKKKKAVLQQEAAQAQSVAHTAATTATQTSDRNYSASVSKFLSKDALKAEENVRKFGTGAGAPLATASSTASASSTGTALDQDLQQDDSPRDTSRNRRNTPPDPQAQLRDNIAADMQKREAAAFFAPLVVISRRPPETTAATSNSTPHASQPPTDPAPPVPVAQPTNSLAGTAPPFAQAPPQLASAPKAPAASDRSARPDRSLTQNSLNNATGPAHKLFEGTSLDAVLTNRLNGTYSGPVNCMLTTDVWSHNRQTLLIPKGTRILGEARKVEGFGQSRLAVSFHRLIMPDGLSISLDTFVGMNQIGETGLKDKVNNHYKQIFGVSIALGAIAGFNMRGTSSGSNANQSGADSWRQGFSQSLGQEATQILDRFLNILPTITIREGTRVKVYLTDDLMLPAYEGHRMSSDL